MENVDNLTAEQQFEYIRKDIRRRLGSFVWTRNTEENRMKIVKKLVKDGYIYPGIGAVVKNVYGCGTFWDRLRQFLKSIICRVLEIRTETPSIRSWYNVLRNPSMLIINVVYRVPVPVEKIRIEFLMNTEEE